MGGAGQWTLDHRRSLINNTKQGAGQRERPKGKGISKPSQRNTNEMKANQAESMKLLCVGCFFQLHV